MARVIGKVCKDLRYPSICDWVIQTSNDIVTGRCTVFHGVGGNRYRTMDESYFNELITGASNQELAGRVYRVYTMKDLFELKTSIRLEYKPKLSGKSVVQKIKVLLEWSILVIGIVIICILIFN